MVAVQRVVCTALFGALLVVLCAADATNVGSLATVQGKNGCEQRGGRCSDVFSCAANTGKFVQVFGAKLCPAPAGKVQDAWVCCFDHDVQKKGPLGCTAHSGKCLLKDGGDVKCDEKTATTRQVWVDRSPSTAKDRLCPFHKDFQCCVTEQFQADDDTSSEPLPAPLPKDMKVPSSVSDVENMSKMEVLATGDLSKNQLLQYFNNLTHAKAKVDPDAPPRRDFSTLDAFLKKLKDIHDDNLSPITEQLQEKMERVFNTMYDFNWNWRRRLLIDWWKNKNPKTAFAQFIKRAKLVDADAIKAYYEDAESFALAVYVEGAPKYLVQDLKDVESKIYDFLKAMLIFHEKTRNMVTYKMRDGFKVDNFRRMFDSYKNCFERAFTYGRNPTPRGECRVALEAHPGAMRLHTFLFAASIDRVAYTIPTFGRVMFTDKEIVTANAPAGRRNLVANPVSFLRNMMFYQGLIGASHGFTYIIQNTFIQVLFDGVIERKQWYNESVDAISSAVAGLMVDLSVKAASLSEADIRGDGGDKFSAVGAASFNLGYFLSAIQFAGQQVLAYQKQMAEWGGKILSWAIKKAVSWATSMGKSSSIGQAEDGAELKIDTSTFNENDKKNMKKGLDFIDKGIGFLADREKEAATKKMDDLLKVFSEPIMALFKNMRCLSCEKQFNEGLQQHKQYESQMVKHDKPAWWEKLGGMIVG